MTKLEEHAMRLVASYTVSHPLNVYSKRIGRVADKASDEVYKVLQSSGGKAALPSDFPVYASLAWEDKMTARGLRLGVEEFKKAHPEHAEELEQIIEHQREVRRNYLEFGIREGAEIPKEVYLQVLADTGVPSNVARSTLNAALKLAEHLEDARGPFKVLM
ncbi:MAG: hypothetical protein QW548_00910 [Candidatus Aenigmatarchaeota archaeon]